jgi:hypothetical protein
VIRRRTLPLLAAALLVACTESAPPERATTRSGPISLRTGNPRSFPVSYVAGNELFDAGTGRTRVLGAAAGAGLLGTLSPAAVPLRAGAVIYNSFAHASPVLRVSEANGRREQIFARDALSAAVRRDGAVAYFQGSKPFVKPKRFLGHVIVRERNSTVRWSSRPGRYVVAAWAGSRLLVYRLREGWPDLLVLDGSQRVRRISRAGALVAISPDGARAVISIYGATPPRVRLVDVETGRPLDRLVLSEPVDGFGVDWLIESGSWHGDLVTASGSAGVVVLRVRGDSIAPVQVLGLDTFSFSPPGWQPVFVRSDRDVAVRVELVSRPREAIPRAALMVCNRHALRCVRGPITGSADGPWLVYDPSRP